MGRANKVVLAYSGGVDTSVCIPYLKREWGVEEVITSIEQWAFVLYSKLVWHPRERPFCSRRIF